MASHHYQKDEVSFWDSGLYWIVISIFVGFDVGIIIQLSVYLYW